MNRALVSDFETSKHHYSGRTGCFYSNIARSRPEGLTSAEGHETRVHGRTDVFEWTIIWAGKDVQNHLQDTL